MQKVHFSFFELKGKLPCVKFMLKAYVLVALHLAIINSEKIYVHMHKLNRVNE